MLKNYFTTAIRHILRNKLYSLINIFGLAVGLAACLLIFLFVRYETSYDNWMPNGENIYRVNYYSSIGDRSIACACIPGIAKGPMEEWFEEIEEAIRFYPHFPVIRHGDKSFKRTVWMADPNFFKVFELPFIEGDADTAFGDLSNIVIARSIAETYFGDSSPIGEVLSFKHQNQDIERSYKISGVFEDLPDNSEFAFKMIFPLDNTLYQEDPGVNTYWYSTWGYLYVKLRDGSNPELINEQLPRLVAENVPPKAEASMPDRTVELALQNIRDIHLYSHGHPFGVVRGIKPSGDIKQVYTFAAIAVVILVIACVNFINLSTAQAMRRAREIGLRKVVGASRKQLIHQFLGESFLVAAFGLLFAFILLDFFMPSVNSLLDLSLGFHQASPAVLILTVLGLMGFVGVVAGLYPAFYLTSSTVETTLSRASGGMRPLASFRGGLTMFQFSIATTLIVTTLIIFVQNQYSLHKDLGFSKENSLVLREMHRPDAVTNREAIVSEISKLPDVEQASLSTNIPSDHIGWVHNMSVEGRPDSSEKALTSISIDSNYFNLYQIPILAGRNIDIIRERDRMGDEPLPDSEFLPLTSVIVNEAVLRLFELGSAEDALGKVLLQKRLEGTRRMEIVGVVPDYHYDSLRDPIRPLVYYYWPDFIWSLTVKYKPNTDTVVLQNDLQDIWDRYVPEHDMRIQYVSDRIAAQYADEIKQSKMLFVFSILAVLIACAGLYGLAAFTAERRTKEIAIRKVHGAEVLDVVKMLLVQFSKPVLLSNLIAWPIAWFFMSDYLEGFVYRIDLSPAYFIGTGIVALLIAWATTTFHAVKAARTRPAIVLRGE